MKTICLLLQMMTTSIVVLAQLPYQHQLFRSQANYPSIVAAMDELLKENPSEEENGLSSNYYRWKYFWDTRVSIKSGVQNSFYPSFAVMKNYWDNKEDYCVSNGSYQGNWKVLGPFDEITTRVNAHENNSGDNIQGNGRVDALWINPEDEDHILAGSISGGLWKTDDGGDSWTCLTDAAGLPAMGIQDVSVDPLNGQHIWMATGSGYIMSSFGYGLGLVYSVDGGDTWQVDEDFLDAVDPDNAQLPIVVKVRFVPGTSTLFACSGNRIFRNLNGTPNAGWEVVLTCPNTELIFDDLEFPPGNNQIILASSTDGNGNGGGAQLWMSQSYGASGTWQEIAGIPNPLANTVTGGDFQDQNLSPYQNSGGGTGNQAWHIVNNGTEYYAAMLPAASTAPNYLYYALPSGRWFTCGADKEFSFVYSLPARSRLTLRVSDDDALDVNNPNPDDLVIWESHPAGTYSSGDVPETSVDAPFSYSCLPPEVFYSKFYFRVELAGDYVNLPGTSVTLDDIVVTSSSAEKIGIDVPDASRCYIMVHYIWDNSKYMYYTENWGITFTLNATLGNTCTTSGISNSCWGELRPDFEVSAGGNHPIFYVGGNTVEKYIWNTGSLMYDAFKISNYGGVESHADIRRLILYNNGTYSDPLSHVLFAGTDGGISKKKLNETTFRNINGNGLAITQYYGFSGIEDEVYEIIGGAQDNGITRIENGAWEHTLFGDGFETAIDFGINAANNEHYVFAESSSGPSPAFNFSSNGGLSFGIGVKPSGWSGAETQVKPMKIIRKNNGASRLYVGGHTDLYYVDDRTGLQSTDFSPFLFKDNFFDPNTDYIPPIISFDLHKEDDEHLYLAYSGNSAGKRLFVVDILSYLSGNGSTGWSDVTGSLPTSSFRITDVVSNPANHEEVWVTFGEIDWPLNSGTNRVFYSDDAGITWHDVSRGLTDFPVNCIVYQEGSDNILYIGTDVGVYVWTHGGGVTNWINPDNKWQCFGTNLPACIVSDLEINYCAGKLRAATWGRGIWESDLYPQTLATPRMQNTATWSSDRKEIQSISIPSGQTLTIVNCTVNMAANTYIKVQPGGTLILDGCTLTNSCGYMWSGIQVLGDPTKKQSPSTNQGVLIMKNGAKIENAYVAAMADEASYSALDYTYPNGKSNGDGVDEHGGGIIQVLFNETDPVTISNSRKGIGVGTAAPPDAVQKF
jgi:hypothetical protein